MSRTYKDTKQYQQTSSGSRQRSDRGLRPGRRNARRLGRTVIQLAMHEAEDAGEINSASTAKNMKGKNVRTEANRA